MEIIKITCPQCQARFTLKAPSMQAVKGKFFKCTKCGCTMPYESLIPAAVPNSPAGANLDPQSQYPDSAAAFHAPTQIQHPSEGRLLLSIVSTGKTFGLSRGRYTLGRDSADSKASVRLAPDKYMSRLHAGISVGNGSARLTNQSNTSPIVVNGRKLEFGRSVEIHPGDNIQIGATKIIVGYQ